VPVAKPQGLFDHARAGAAAQIPGTEADERNARAFGFDGRDGLGVSAYIGHAGALDRDPDPIKIESDHDIWRMIFSENRFPL
jgi:hypothetical protein